MAPAHIDFKHRREFWSTPEGLQRVREAVEPRVPYLPEEWQIRLPAAALAGRDVLLILRTGGGKTSLVSHTTFADPDSITLMVSPLNLLEDNQVERFAKQGIRAVAINADALVVARCGNRDLWQEAREGRHQVILTSPEMLDSTPFGKLIDDKAFRSLLARFVVDEAHTIVEWRDSFRPAYALLTDMRERLPDHVTFLAMTATLPPGPATDAVIQTLGFRLDRLVLERRDCERTDMDIFIRELQNGIDAATTFPDLDWVVPETVSVASDVPKTLVYCDQIELTHRVASYLRSLLPSALRTQGATLIRTVTSLSCPQCKAEALSTLQEQGQQRRCSLHISTDVLSMGVDVSDIVRVICLGTPSSLSNMLQRVGRVARAEGLRGAAYVYVRMSDMKWARAEALRLETAPVDSDVHGGPARGTRGRGGRRARGRGSRGSARGAAAGPRASGTALLRTGRESKCPLFDRLLISVAKGTCINRENNRIMGNANKDDAYECGACSSCCNDVLPEPRARDDSSSADTSGSPSAVAIADASDVLAALSDLAAELWLSAETARSFSSRVFLSDQWKERIATSLSTLEDNRAIAALMRDWKYWPTFGGQLSAAVLAQRGSWLATIASNRKRRLAKARSAQSKKRNREDRDDEVALVQRARREATREAIDEAAYEPSDNDGSDEGEATHGSNIPAAATATTSQIESSAPTGGPVAQPKVTRRKRHFPDAVESRRGEEDLSARGRKRRKVLYDRTNI